MIDRLGHFWVVLKAGKHSVREDVLFKTDVHDMMLRFSGGLQWSEISQINKLEHESSATSAAAVELILRRRDK